MYSVILLTTMTATAEAPSFGDIWAKKCFWECCWPARYGWVPCGGGLPYYPTPYYGCVGGHHHYHTCYGCGACYGCVGFGYGHGWGYGHGCWSPSYSCYGGGVIYAGVGYAGFGAYGNYGMYGAVPYIGAPAFAPPIQIIHPANGGTQQETKPIPAVKPLVEAITPNGTASILMKVPAEAKVFIDNYQMKSTSAERLFTSPELEPGKNYFYTIRVVVEKDGKPVEDSRRVVIRAGETSRIAFDRLDRPGDDYRAIAGVKP
jgi:uncharacterized protein (TIGR03000 family)